jgi:hypothetical protein
VSVLNHGRGLVVHQKVAVTVDGSLVIIDHIGEYVGGVLTVDALLLQLLDLLIHSFKLGKLAGDLLLLLLLSELLLFGLCLRFSALGVGFQHVAADTVGYCRKMK